MNELLPAANVSPLELASQFGITDPKVLRVLEFMNQQQQETEETPVEETPVSTGIDPGKWNRLLRKNRELHEENEYLIELTDSLAAALGACPACWGEDEHCDECRGRGGPGAFLPDEEAFADVVLPAIRRMRELRRAPVASASEMPTTRHDNQDPPTTDPEVQRGKENA